MQLTEIRTMLEDMRKSQQSLARSPTMKTLRQLRSGPPSVDGMSTRQNPATTRDSSPRRVIAFEADGTTVSCIATTDSLDVQGDYVAELDFRILQNQRHEATRKMESGEYSAAEFLLIQVIEKSNKLYGTDYYWRDTARTMLVRGYMEQHKWDEAERELLQIAAEQEQNNRPRESAETKHNLALLAFTKGDYIRAESYCQQAIFDKTHVLGNAWDHSVYVSMELLVQILQANNDTVKASVYEEKLKDGTWMRERNAISKLCVMSAFKASVEIGVNYLVDLLPSNEGKEERLEQIQRNIRKRTLGFCGSGYGYNLFHAAVEFGQEDTVQYLLDIEENARLLDLDSFINVRDKDGNSPLHLAAKKGRLEIVRLLLMHGADVNIKSKDLQTPLIVAAKAGSVDVVRLLLEYHPDLTAKDDIGWAVLHLAIFENQGEIVELLLENGADVGMLGASGRTPLHCAAVREREDIVRLLLEKGANSKAKSAEGKTPLELAEKYRKESIVRILRHVSQTRKRA